MKKVVLTLGLLTLVAGGAFAKDKKKDAKAKASKEAAAAAAPAASAPVADPHAGHDHGAPAAAAPQAPATSLTVDNIVFKNDTHDFGMLAEGAAADHDFVLTNTGKEPLIIQRVQASCGCTTPDWTKEPILPGKTGFVKASYGTQGRPGPFNKTLTVLTNAGAKVLTIRGEVEKAPTTSVPENNSMIKTN